jgi:hypothetical protein
MKDNLTTNVPDEAQNPAFLVGAVISRFSIDDLDACWNDYPKERLIDILNGDYSVKDARDDLRSLIGTKYDARQNGL